MSIRIVVAVALAAVAVYVEFKHCRTQPPRPRASKQSQIRVPVSKGQIADSSSPKKRGWLFTRDDQETQKSAVRSMRNS
jgi:hypothetical protein